MFENLKIIGDYSIWTRNRMLSIIEAFGLRIPVPALRDYWVTIDGGIQSSIICPHFQIRIFKNAPIFDCNINRWKDNTFSTKEVWNLGLKVGEVTLIDTSTQINPILLRVVDGRLVHTNNPLCLLDYRW